MISPLQEFYLKQEEPNQSCFVALKEIILQSSPHLTEEWKYKLPFFYFKGKVFCYLWKDKKTNIPYIGFMQHGLEDDSLFKGDRKRVQILSVNPEEDIDIETINRVLEKAIVIHN